MKIILIAIGGAIGSVLRYLVSVSTYRWLDKQVFPWGTFTVNALGSFLIGFIWAMSENNYVSSGQRTFIFIGLLGGFTTFSSFSLETMNLIRAGELGYSLLNIALNNISGIILAFAGFFAGKYFFSA